MKAEATGVASPVWWWQLHQVARMGVVAGMVYGVWRVHATVHTDWTLALLLAYVAAGAINGTLRAHLLFISAFARRDIDEQLSQTGRVLRTTDLAVSILLLIGAAVVARGQTVLPSILAAVAVGWAATSRIVEPAVAKAAFPPGQ